MNTHKKKNDFEAYKHDLLKVAKDLHYSEVIMKLISEAQTEGEAIRAMMRGRKEMRD